MQIAHAQLRARDHFGAAVRQQPPRVDFGQPAQGPHGLLRAQHAALFEHMADGHDDGQQRRGHQIAGGPGGDQRQRDQPVGDAVQAGMAQAGPGFDEHRHGDQRRGDAGHQFGDAVLGRDKQIVCRPRRAAGTTPPAPASAADPAPGARRDPADGSGAARRSGARQDIRMAVRRYSMAFPGKTKRAPLCGSTRVTEPTRFMISATSFDTRAAAGCCASAASPRASSAMMAAVSTGGTDAFLARGLGGAQQLSRSRSASWRRRSASVRATATCDRRPGSPPARHRMPIWPRAAARRSCRCARSPRPATRRRSGLQTGVHHDQQTSRTAPRSAMIVWPPAAARRRWAAPPENRSGSARP